MQFVVPGVLVPDPEDVVSITVETGKCDGLETVHDRLLHLRRDRLARRKA